MYLNTYGGSALLHLLAAHPRVVALFGLAATASLLIAPHGPGRQVGTAGHIERIEAAIRPQSAITEERQAAAEQAAERLIAAGADREISAIVGETLRRCGPGCTDISTERIVSDEELLYRVIVLHELDIAARNASGDRAGAPSTPTPQIAPAGSSVRR